MSKPNRLLRRSLPLVAAAGVALGGCARTGLSFGETSGDEFDFRYVDAGDARDMSDAPPDIPDLPDIPDAPPDLAPDVCGDGIVGPTERCDDGPANSDIEPDACRTDCTPPRCGDGVIDTDEPCDDGNDIENDECSSDCLLPAEPCTACETDAACGRAIDRCARLLDGDFCTRACGAERECPLGLVCGEIGTITGVRAAQCIPEFRVCAGCFDQDEDGYGIGVECLGFDCDDRNPEINPGATEVCDDIDNDCDGQNDEGCPPDLIVDAETVELSGVRLYDRVEVRNEGVIVVERPPFELTAECAPDGPGCLDITARIIVIREDSGINAIGSGQCERGVGDAAGFGPGLRNVGPGGGGYGGVGGAGPGLAGGPTYGSDGGPDIAMGSPGRGFDILVPGFDGGACDDLVGFNSSGGGGGGCVALRAPDVQIRGYVVANGVRGQAATDGSTPAIVDGGAGGSGGGVLVDGRRVAVFGGATLSAAGGAGGRGGTYGPLSGENVCVGNGGGGGGGGRIKIFARERGVVEGALTVRPGAGATGPQNDGTAGTAGTIHVAVP